MGREEVSFASGEGQCAASLFRPESGDGQAPCVVLGSGLSCVRDQGLDAFGERFAAAGIAALAFDYRHFGDSGGEPRGLMSAARQRDDFRAALSCARSFDAVDPNRLALWGYSLGGGHVQALAASEPGVAAAIAVAPVIDGARTLLYIGGPAHLLRLAAEGARDALRALRGAEPHRIPAAGPPGSLAVLNSPESVGGFESISTPQTTWSNELCARTVLTPPYRLTRKTRQIERPILYCLTEDDDINPPTLGAKAAQRAPRGELRLYPGGHFSPFLGETFERMATDQVDFIRRRLAPGSTSVPSDGEVDAARR